MMTGRGGKGRGGARGEGQALASGGGVYQSALAENGALGKEARHLTSEMVSVCCTSPISTSSAWSLSLERNLRVRLSPNTLLQPLPLLLLIPLSFSHTLSPPPHALCPASLYSLSLFSSFLLPFSSPLFSFLPLPLGSLLPFSSLCFPLLPLYHSLSLCVSIFPSLAPPHQPQPQQEPFVSRSSAGGSRNLLLPAPQHTPSLAGLAEAQRLSLPAPQHPQSQPSHLLLPPPSPPVDSGQLQSRG